MLLFYGRTAARSDTVFNIYKTFITRYNVYIYYIYVVLQYNSNSYY